MTGAVAASLYAVVLATSFASAPDRPSDAQARRRPIATIVGLVVVGLPALAQLTVAPSLLEHLRRDWTAIGSGQLWRLVTSLVVQDGGIAGALFNLAALAVIGSAAEALWGVRRWVILVLATGVGAQLWGWVVQPVGGGNSVAVFGLATSLAVLGLREGDRAHRLLAAVCLIASALLLVAGDIHGGAAAIGAALAAGMTHPRHPGRTSSLTDSVPDDQ